MVLKRRQCGPLRRRARSLGPRHPSEEARPFGSQDCPSGSTACARADCTRSSAIRARRVRHMAHLISLARKCPFASSASAASPIALASPLLQARALLPLRRSSGKWPSYPSRDRRIAPVSLGNPPERGCARAIAISCGLAEGSQTSVRPSTDFPRPLLHARLKALAPSADRVTGFPRVVLRVRNVESARAHSAPRESPHAPRRIPKTHHAKSLGSRCGLSRPIRVIPMLSYAQSVDRSGASLDRIRRVRIADPPRSADSSCG